MFSISCILLTSMPQNTNIHVTQYSETPNCCYEGSKRTTNKYYSLDSVFLHWHQFKIKRAEKRAKKLADKRAFGRVHLSYVSFLSVLFIHLVVVILVSLCMLYIVVRLCCRKYLWVCSCAWERQRWAFRLCDFTGWWLCSLNLYLNGLLTVVGL